MTIYIGYGRCSLDSQCIDLQLNALRKDCGERIWTEHRTGTTRIGRIQLQAALAEAKRLSAAGNDVVFQVYSLSRLGRSIADVIELVKELETSGIAFQSLSEAILTGTPSGNFLLNIMASVAQMEVEQLKERTRAGLAAARIRLAKEGRQLGRPVADNTAKVAQAKQLASIGRTKATIAAEMKCSVAQVYRLLAA